jgi:NAD(P)-dependent dehydrogenase (short-subunit alcohol dehydrogenase family)
MNRIDGTIAVNTGGTQGLGEAVARLFAKAGAAGIAIVGRDQANGDCCGVNETYPFRRFYNLWSLLPDHQAFSTQIKGAC